MTRNRVGKCVRRLLLFFYGFRYHTSPTMLMLFDQLIQRMREYETSFASLTGASMDR